MARSGKTALVTGASAGLGVEFARLAAKDGHDVVLVARRRDRLVALADELQGAHGVKATVIAVDLALPSGPLAIWEQCRAAGIEVDYLINNAGFGARGPFVASDLKGQLGMIDVNVRALLELTYRFLPGMVARKSGCVLNVGSIAGFVPGPFMATYYASKAFVVSFTEALATELRGTGVTVTATCPGPTLTEFGTVAGSATSNLFRRGAADAASVARHGYQAMLAGRVLAIPGFKNKATLQALRFSPRSTMRAVAANLNHDVTPPEKA